MTFLNASLLAGLLAIAIPVAVHLISRRQPRRVVFPATRFLQHRIESSRSKLRIRRWWLLALRMLAVAAFALALARPQIETAMAPRWFAVALLGLLGIGLLAMAGAAIVSGQSTRLRYTLAAAAVLALLAAAITGGVTAARGPEVAVGDDLPVAMAIVIDNSIRTSRIVPPTQDDGDSIQSAAVIERMKGHAQWMIGRYPKDSRVAVIDRSQRPAAFSIDVSSALRQIERTEPIALTRPLSERIEAAVRLVRSSDLQRSVVLLITDLTAQSFPESDWNNTTIQSLLMQDPPMRLQILDVGSEPIGNRKLSPLVISDVTPPRLTPTAVSTLLQSEGSPLGGDADAGRTVTVEMQLYDSSAPQANLLPIVRDQQTVLPPLRTVDRTTVNLSTAATRVLLSVPPLDIGTHHGLVRIVGDDELAIDDKRYFTLQVRPSASVLLVSADRDSAGVIGGALTAPLAIDDPSAEYRIDVVELLPSKRETYANHEAIVLIDPAEPSPANVADLQAFLANGGKLISMLGPSLGRGMVATNSQKASASAAVSATTFPKGTLRRWRVPPPGTFLEIARPNHPAMMSLANVAGGVPWNLFPINQYWQLDPQPGDTVVMRYAGTDHPALIDRRGTGEISVSSVGDAGGLHLILTTPLPALAGPSRGWNDLFAGADAWPAFLLVREMMQSLIDAQRGTFNLLITDLPSIPVDQQESWRSEPPAFDSAVTSDTAAVAATSDSADVLPVTITGGDRPKDTDRVFQMFPPVGPPVPLRTSGPIARIGNVEEAGTYWLRGAGVTTGFSVNLLPQQTDLTRIDAAKLDQWFGSEQYDLVRNREQLRQAEGRGAPTRPLYAWILFLMAGAFVLEQVLSNRFYRSKRSGVGGGQSAAVGNLFTTSQLAGNARAVRT